MNERINWSVIEEDFKNLYSHTGRPAKLVRLMVSLLLLKQLEDLKGAERLLKLSIELFNPKIQKEEVVIDTTVKKKKISPIPPIPNWRKKSLTSEGTLRIRKGFP